MRTWAEMHNCPESAPSRVIIPATMSDLFVSRLNAARLCEVARRAELHRSKFVARLCTESRRHFRGCSNRVPLPNAAAAAAACDSYNETFFEIGARNRVPRIVQLESFYRYRNALIVARFGQYLALRCERLQYAYL